MHPNVTGVISAHLCFEGKVVVSGSKVSCESARLTQICGVGPTGELILIGTGVKTDAAQLKHWLSNDMCMNSRDTLRSRGHFTHVSPP